MGHMHRESIKLLPRLPGDLIIPSFALKIVRVFYEVLADRVLAPHQPLEHTPSQDVPLQLMNDIFDLPDALQVLAELWEEGIAQTTTREGRDTPGGSMNELMKARFYDVVVKLLPVLNLRKLPKLAVGITDVRRTEILRSECRKDPLKLLLSDGVATSGNLFRPFNSRDV